MRTTKTATSRVTAWLAAPSLALAIVACGSAQQQPPRAPSPPEAPPVAEAPSAPSTSPPSDGAPPAGYPQAAPPAAADAAEAPEGSRASASASMTDQVGATLKQAEHDIASGNCPTACRALASMERAVAFLCTGNKTTEETDRCESARHHLLRARHGIRTTCGNCPGGPSVEPDAPIPSTPMR
jgi:hypothetical protein